MHGSPLLRALGAFLVILTLGIPLWRLTHPAAVAAAAAPAAEGPGTPGTKAIELQLAFTRPPTRFEVLALGEKIWSESAPAGEAKKQLRVRYPKEGIDLEFKIEWPEGALAAARIRLKEAEAPEIEKSVWGSGPTDEVATFP